MFTGDYFTTRSRESTPTLSPSHASLSHWGFSSDDEDWSANRREGRTSLSSDEERQMEHGVDDVSDIPDGTSTSFFRELLSSNLTLKADVVDVSNDETATIPPELLVHARAIQRHFLSFNQLLGLDAGLDGQSAFAHPGFSRIEQLENDLRSARAENKVLVERNEGLNTVVRVLRNQATESRQRKVREKVENTKSWEARPDETSRVSIGVDPSAISDLAFDLASATRSPNDIADALFALADDATPYPSGPEELQREKLPPRERLTNLEGILDVTLGRMEDYEKKASDAIGGKTMKKESLDLGRGVGVFEGAKVREVELSDEEDEDVEHDSKRIKIDR